MSLNIFLSDEVKKKNPDFSKLLDDVILKYQNSLNTKVCFIVFDASKVLIFPN